EALPVIVLLDTDVLIDLALDRVPYSEAAAGLLDTLEQRPGSAFVAWHSLSNFFYMVAPSRGKHQTKDFLLDLTRFVLVARRRPRRAFCSPGGSISRILRMRCRSPRLSRVRRA